MSHKFTNVIRGHTASVEDAHGLRRLVTIHLTEKLANIGNYLARAFCGGGFAGADSPDRLVGNHYLFHIFGWQMAQTMLCLTLNYFPGLTSVILIWTLADAHNRVQPVTQGCQRFLVDQFVAFAEVSAALGVT